MDKDQLRLCGVRKSFGGTEALRGLDLSVRQGEFLTILGPSGCGKTTMLRVIAGLEAPDEGRVFLSGIDVTGLEPHKRDVRTVFQSYALFPHMDVETNIGYSLRLKRAPRHEIKRAVAEALELVRLPGFQGRMPGELSGGQRQRVAIARAVIQRPKVLLLDEPLGALDLQLRRLMQTELKKLQQQLGITFVYITHDQEEALTMSDRIAVMRDGRLEQTGTAAEVYDRPQTSYVARFVGNANLLGGTVTGRDGGIVSFSCHGAEVKTDASGVGRDYERGDQITVAVRAESIDIFHDGSNGGMPVLVTGKSFAGGMLRITMSPVARSGHTPPKEAVPEERGGEGPAEIVAGRYGVDSPFSPGQNAWINWPPERAVPVDVAKTSDKAVGRQRGSLKPEGAGSSWAAAGERARREAALAGVGKK